jgi:hypothetical protein
MRPTGFRIVDRSVEDKHGPEIPTSSGWSAREQDFLTRSYVVLLRGWSPLKPPILQIQ